MQQGKGQILQQIQRQGGCFTGSFFKLKWKLRMILRNYGEKSERLFHTYFIFIRQSFLAKNGRLWYKEDGINHEIKVNQRTIDIVKGCGSYGDPYVITDAATLEAIAAYMINNASMPDHITLVDMQEGITETNGGFELCTESKSKRNHRTYEKDGSSWVEVEQNENDE